MIRISLAALTALALPFAALAAQPFDDKFRQLDELLPTPNTYRTASGAPGHEYWQQRADYAIKVKLDEKTHTLTASADIDYHNRSPDALKYVWVQLDQNLFRPDSAARLSQTSNRDQWNGSGTSFNSLRTLLTAKEFPGGFNIQKVSGRDGKALRHTINGTMMRIDLPQQLLPGQTLKFSIDWSYNITDMKILGGRSGYEFFKEDGNHLYEMAQWFPRMAAYYDVMGWQHKQFLGAGEFTLEFGDYDVQITVPADHVVASTGELQNPDAVLTATQRERLKKARTADKPVIIVTQEEAEKAEKTKSEKTKTWHFKAKNVRDFAWASSRKFIWDAQGYKKDGTDVLAMSYYPKEGNPLWEMYSTQAIIHTIEHYNKYSFDYPYPVAISVNGPVGGMEYPMISFNGPRPEKDKKTGEITWSKRTKYGLIGVIIHEVGHNYYPMIINSDERQWTWMDEGLNTFVQFLAEQAWEEKYPASRGEARDIINYMKSADQVPIMTNSESLLQFGNNAYSKPATALNILRETILGRELFDFAFREYGQRWKFKRPTPADFFRTMEDASGTDLDWFWRGWFYTTDHVDISLDNITEFTVNTKDPEVEKAWERARHDAQPISITRQRNKGVKTRLDDHPELKDFYNENDDFIVTNKARNEYNAAVKDLEDWEKDLLKSGKYFYLVDFSNKGGLVMPLILALETEDGETSIERIPAEVWRYSPEKITKLVISDKPLKSITQDPYWETADVDQANNRWPRELQKSRLKLFKDKRDGMNLMKDAREKLKTDEKKDEDAKSPENGDKAAAEKKDGEKKAEGQQAASAENRQ